MHKAFIYSALGAFILAGCGGDAEPGSECDTLNTSTELTTDGGTYTVSYQSDPAPIPLNDAFLLTFDVERSDGAALGEISLDADGAMPAHGHGMNTSPSVVDLGDGLFEADGFLFHMGGHWTITADIQDGSQTESAVFNVCIE